MPFFNVNNYNILGRTWFFDNYRQAFSIVVVDDSQVPYRLNAFSDDPAESAVSNDTAHVSRHSH